MKTIEQKAAHNAYMKLWKARNPEKVQALNKRYREKTPYEERNACDSRQPEARKSYAAQKYQERKDSGMCVYCQDVPARPNSIICADCQTKTTAYARIRKYGVTREQFLAKLATQESRCAICGIDIGEDAHVDHDHDTKQVRDLLCGHCNRGVGLFRDSADIVLKAAAYLNKWGLK